MESDLIQSVVASYLASKNIFTDNTTIKSKSKFNNSTVHRKTMNLYAEAAKFVVAPVKLQLLSEI